MRIDREKLTRALAEALQEYRQKHGRSRALYAEKGSVLLYRSPMNWMQMWPGGFPVSVKRAWSDQLEDVDGNCYLDLCLGYSAAFPSHPDGKRTFALAGMAESGMVHTLPNDIDTEVGALLKARFGLPYWGFALSATDANRFVIKLARAVTDRKKILVCNGCYHGTVEETFAALDHGTTVEREGQIGAGSNIPAGTTAVEFNDTEALRQALETGEYACYILEPAMTNCGIIPPEPGYLQQAKKLCRENGTLFILDEAHTITTGYRGYAGEYDLSPDILVFGKCLGGGFPVGAYGVTEILKEEISRKTDPAFADTSGIGGTMTGSPLALRAIRETLTRVLTPDAFAAARKTADVFREEMDAVFAEFSLPWHVEQLGARADIQFTPKPAQNAAGSFSVHDPDLYAYLFVSAMNAGYLFSPYYNIMATFSDRTETIRMRELAGVFRILLEKILL